MFDALRDELAQIRDLLEHYKRGEFHHAIGLSAIIRKAIAVGSPMPLVQLCAAMIDAPLIIYTRPQRPSKWPSTLPLPNGSLEISGSHAPDVLHKNPVDLDVWLDFHAMQIGTKTFTNKTLLKKIGDTLGGAL